MFSQGRHDTKIIKEVTVNYEKVKYHETGIGVMGSDNRKAFASFIENNWTEESQRYFNSIKFMSTNFGKKTAEIYLCIYENNNGLPGKIIESGKILITVPSKNNIVTADLSKLQLQVPRNGYFIGFEWILSKENRISGNTPTLNFPYNPTISGFTAKAINLYSYEGKWRKQEDSNLVAGLALEISYLQN